MRRDCADRHPDAAQPTLGGDGRKRSYRASVRDLGQFKIQDSKFNLYDIFNSRTTEGEGMTFKEAFKYVINTGAKCKHGSIKISKYFMISNALQLKHAIYANGPCVAVLPVYNEDEQFWQKTGNCIGYHAVAIVGYDENGFIIRNSWGEYYGHNGYSYISNDDINHIKEAWTMI